MLNLWSLFMLREERMKLEREVGFCYICAYMSLEESGGWWWEIVHLRINLHFLWGRERGKKIIKNKKSNALGAQWMRRIGCLVELRVRWSHLCVECTTLLIFLACEHTCLYLIWLCVTLDLIDFVLRSLPRNSLCWLGRRNFFSHFNFARKSVGVSYGTCLWTPLYGKERGFLFL